MSDMEQMVWHLVDGKSVKITLRESLTRFKQVRESHLKSRKRFFAKFGKEDPWKDYFEAFYDDVDEALKNDA